MRLSTADLAFIDARASTLSERLKGEYVESGDDSRMASRRLARLKQVAGDEPEALGSKINALVPGEITETRLLASLGSVRRASSASMPRWLTDLNLIVEGIALSFTSKNDNRIPTTRSHRRARAVPYEHLYWPIAECAWKRAILKCSSDPVQLDTRASFGLQDSLVRRISSIASAILHPGFLANVSLSDSSMMQHLFGAKTSGESNRRKNKHYANFVTEQGESGLAPLFLRFPVAARLIVEVMRLWVDFVNEFLERLQRDAKEIALCFNGGAPLGSLTGVKANLSDSHHGGRSVLILTFRGGLRLVYKPRPMGIDRLFYALVEKIDRQNPQPGFRSLKISDQGSYGWMEFAQHESCTSKSAVQRYFQRTGALACLIHWLQGIDFHRENVVAAGEQPLLVDLECLAHPLRQDELSSATASSPACLAYSILRTGLLPMWQSPLENAALYDNCGFGAPVRQSALLPTPKWKQVNTDRMHVASENASLCHSAHRAYWKRRILSISAFEREVLSGFRKMTRILQGPDEKTYSEFRETIYRAYSRRIKRPTFLYAMILRHSLSPAYLIEGVDRSIELLMLPYSGGEDSEWNTEMESLEKLDIPYFHHPSSTKTLLGTPVRWLGEFELAQQLKTLSASIRRQVRLKEGKVIITHRHRAKMHPHSPDRVL